MGKVTERKVFISTYRFKIALVSASFTHFILSFVVSESLFYIFFNCPHVVIETSQVIGDSTMATIRRTELPLSLLASGKGT